jgi:hypothetical protein
MLYSPSYWKASLNKLQLIIITDSTPGYLKIVHACSMYLLGGLEFQIRQLYLFKITGIYNVDSSYCYYYYYSTALLVSRPTPNLEDQVSEFISSGDRLAQMGSSGTLG